jgi:two-component system, NarL family, nitrate/nitrite response regulator NarL
VNYPVTYEQAPITSRGSSLLTARQREMFDLIVVGYSNKEIARTLGLSQGTVKIHITKLFDKLGVRHRSAVALAGAKLGLSLVPLPRLVA